MPVESIRALFSSALGGESRCPAKETRDWPCRTGRRARCRTSRIPRGGTRISDLSVGLAFIRRSACCVPLGFALGQLLLLLLLFFLAPCAGRPLSLRSISTVIWLECHRILLCA